MMSGIVASSVTGCRFFAFRFLDSNSAVSMSLSELAINYAGGVMPASAMSSNSAPSPYVIDASQPITPPGLYYRAFDKLTSLGITVSRTNIPFQIGIDVGSLIIPTSISITALTGSSAPKQFTVYGSPSGFYYTGGGDSRKLIDKTGETGWSNTSVRTYPVL